MTILLQRLSAVSTWQAIEADLGRTILRVYELTPERVRLDATTVSGYHAGAEEGMFQFGHSKDDPSLRQVKVMMAALDPLGLPLVSQVVSGNHPDDPLYIPAIDQVLKIIDGIGLLFVGDCKMSALAIQAHIQRLNHHYLCPLAMTGSTASEIVQWIEAAQHGGHALQSVYVESAQFALTKLSDARNTVDAPPNWSTWIAGAVTARLHQPGKDLSNVKVVSTNGLV